MKKISQQSNKITIKFKHTDTFTYLTINDNDEIKFGVNSTKSEEYDIAHRKHIYYDDNYYEYDENYGEDNYLNFEEFCEHEGFDLDKINTDVKSILIQINDKPYSLTGLNEYTISYNNTRITQSLPIDKQILMLEDMLDNFKNI